MGNHQTRRCVGEASRPLRERAILPCPVRPSLSFRLRREVYTCHLPARLRCFLSSPLSYFSRVRDINSPTRQYDRSQLAQGLPLGVRYCEVSLKCSSPANTQSNTRPATKSKAPPTKTAAATPSGTSSVRSPARSPTAPAARSPATLTTSTKPTSPCSNLSERKHTASACRGRA
jgi:hypothetical protein